MPMYSLRKKPRHLALIALFAAIAVAPMLFRGMPGGNDVAQNYEFAKTVIRSLEAGDLWRSFDGAANDGMGEIRLRVYPPLAYYGLSAAYILIRDWYLASLVIFFLIFLVGAIGIYLLTAQMASTSAALAAAAIYTFSPFHLNEIYNNFLYAQFAAGAILPFCFLFLYRVIKNGRFLDCILLAISFALLVATHLPLTIIASLSMAAFSLAMARRSNLRNLLWSMFSVLLGLGLSAFYWVRLLTEMDWAKHSQPEYFSNIWSYKVNFLLSSRTFTDFMNDNLSLWFGDLMFVATLLICVPAIITLKRSSDERRAVVPIFAVWVFGVFMATPVSTFVWDNVAVLQKTQFPWRWLTVVSLAAAVLASVGLVRIGEQLRITNSRALAVATAAAILPFVLLSAFVVRAGVFTGRAEFNAQLETLRDKQTYEGWWPIWATAGAFSRKENVSIPDRKVRYLIWQPSTRVFMVEPGKSQEAEIKLFFYPHWKAQINSADVETQSATDGVVSLAIPSALTEVRLTFVEPAQIVAAKWISLIAWAALMTILISFLWMKRERYGTYS